MTARDVDHLGVSALIQDFKDRVGDSKVYGVFFVIGTDEHYVMFSPSIASLPDRKALVAVDNCTLFGRLSANTKR